MQFNNSAVSAGEVAKRLGVDAVLESTVSYIDGGSAGGPGRVRVNTSLVRAGASAPEWSKSFDKSFNDLLALQADLARAIALTIRASITPGESERLNRSPRIDPAAEEAYFEGRMRQIDAGRKLILAGSPCVSHNTHDLPPATLASKSKSLLHDSRGVQSVLRGEMPIYDGN